MADIKIYGKLVNATPEAIIADAQQINAGSNKTQSQKNQELEEHITQVEAKQVMAVTMDNITGEISLHYDNNSNVTDAMLGNDGKLRIIYEI